jgi:hypothetical protein
MAHGNMRLLNSRCVARRDIQRVIDYFCNFSPILPRQADRDHAYFLRRFKSFHHIRRGAAGAQSPGDIPGQSDSPDLLTEDLGKIIIIANACDDRGIGRQGNGGQGRSLNEKPVYKFTGDMLGVSCRFSLRKMSLT